VSRWGRSRVIRHAPIINIEPILWPVLRLTGDLMDDSGQVNVIAKIVRPCRIPPMNSLFGCPASRWYIEYRRWFVRAKGYGLLTDNQALMRSPTVSVLPPNAEHRFGNLWSCRFGQGHATERGVGHDRNNDRRQTKNTTHNIIHSKVCHTCITVQRAGKEKLLDAHPKLAGNIFNYIHRAPLFS
jgi:hypothetical protein